MVAPQKETEAWMLADRSAAAGALGYINPSRLADLPSSAEEAERLSDPKARMQRVMATAGWTRAHLADEIASQIAVRQDLQILFGARSFRAFIENLRLALADMNVIQYNE